MSSGLSGSGVQRSFEELGTPLVDVTFCVIDFETTGSSPQDCSITEIGAVKLRGGECLGTLQTLVNPGRAIPPTITVLTGITQSMVCRAPRIEEVLGTFVDFIGDAVIVAHNARFDLAFLQAALRRDGRDELTNLVIDTVPLARRLLRDEVANCKLGTLARHFRFPNQPSHRALDDALATGDLLHVIVDRARSLGVTGLDDLRTLPQMANHAQAAKLPLTDRLPRSPGVYLFRDPTGTVLYVGKATNLRARVRSYFSTEDRRKVGRLLTETSRIDHKVTATELEAAVLEIRLIHHLLPRYNQQGTGWRNAVYVELSGGTRPRLRVVRSPGSTANSTTLGPISSRAVARQVVDAIRTVIDLPDRPVSRIGDRSAVPARDMGTEDGAAAVALARRCLHHDPSIVINALSDRMADLAAQERFEEASGVRDALAAFIGAVQRQRALNRLRGAVSLEVQDRLGGRYLFRRGQLIRYWDPAGDQLGFGRDIEAVPADPGDLTDGPLHAELADELLLTGRWLERNADRLRLCAVEGQFASTSAPVPVPGRVHALRG